MIVWDQIILALASFVLFFLLHVMLWQNESIKFRGVYLLTKIAVISYVLVAVISQYFIGLSIQDHLWVSGPLHFCLLMLYMHLYVGIDKSISIRILGELVNNPTKTLTWKKLIEIYQPQQMVETRLTLLVEKRWLKNENRRYQCLPKAVRLVKINLFFKKLFQIEKTG